MYFFDAPSLTGEDLAKIDFSAAQTDAPATGDHDGFVVEAMSMEQISKMENGMEALPG